MTVVHLLGRGHICAPYTPRGQDAILVALAPQFTTITPPLLQVSATDEDGPLNSALTYSLVGGNQLGHFAIHPKKGELQVAKALDWEQVSHVGGAQFELIKAEYSSATGQENDSELASLAHTSPDPPPLVFSVVSLWLVRPEAGEGLSDP